MTKLNKQTNSNKHWALYKHARNNTTTLIRKAKQTHFNKLAKSSKDPNITSANYWSVIKNSLNLQMHQTS